MITADEAFQIASENSKESLDVVESQIKTAAKRGEKHLITYDASEIVCDILEINGFNVSKNHRINNKMQAIISW